MSKVTSKVGLLDSLETSINPATKEQLPAALTVSGNYKVSIEEGGAGDGNIQDGVDSSIKATVLDYTNSNPLSVRLTNTDGDYVSAGAGTEYTEDAASPADPKGGAVLVTRDDQLSNVTEAAGDWSRLRGTAKGALWVALADASGDPITSFGGGTEYTEDVATANPQVGKAIMMERDDALTTVTPAEGDWIGCRGTAEGALWVQDFNSDASLALLGTMDADTGAIKTAVEILDNAISGSEMQCDIVASLPAGTNNIGDVDVEKNVGTLSPNNSTTTPLGIDAVFTGTADDIKDYAAINISIWADQASATDGLSIEWSQDGTNWDEKMTVSIGASKVESYEFGVRARYFRIVYTNGGTEQTAFRLQVMYHPVRTREGARCLCVDIDSREFASTERAILAAKKPNGDYTNIHATADGNLKLALEELDATLIGGGTEASALRVTLANDSTGLVSIDDGGGSITVDGTFYQATQPVSGTFWQATQPVSLASVPSHAVTNAGTFAVQIVDTSFAVADGNALGEGVLIQGDDGTDRKNINVDATTGDVQVDVTNSVAVTGTFWQATQPISGTVTANLSATDNAVLDTIDSVLDTINAKLVSGTDIGDVTINNAAGAAAVNIQDGGNTITVDGTITANLSATDNAVLDTIAGDTTSLDGKVTACNTGAVVVSSGTITANLGATDNAVLDAIDAVLDTIKVDTEAIETAVEGTLTVDLGANNDVTATGSVAHDGADSGNPIKTGGRAQEPTTAPDEVADNDRVDTLHDRVGRVATYQGYPRWYAAINTATSGNNTIKAAAGAGKKIVVTSVVIVSDGTVDIRWESAAGGTALSGQIPLQEREGYSASDPNGLFQTAANALLNLELSAAINVHGHIAGIIIDD